MHQVVHAVRAGLVDPEAVLYGLSVQLPTPHQAGRPLTMGDTLPLMGGGAGTALRSSAPARLHALRTCPSADEAPYLNQARAKYQVSELDVALHLLHLPEEFVEVAEVTVFVEGADDAPPGRHRLTRCMTG